MSAWGWTWELVRVKGTMDYRPGRVAGPQVEAFQPLSAPHVPCSEGPMLGGIFAVFLCAEFIL
jgi:hypothetical protein